MFAVGLFRLFAIQLSARRISKLVHVQSVIKKLLPALLPERGSRRLQSMPTCTPTILGYQTLFHQAQSQAPSENQDGNALPGSLSPLQSYPDVPRLIQQIYSRASQATTKRQPLQMRHAGAAESSQGGPGGHWGPNIPGAKHHPHHHHTPLTLAAA
jgi:hypothetical protein